jgi:hypothetical protein
MMKSEIYVIELVARMIADNDVDDESSLPSTLPEAVDEQYVKCGVIISS